MQPFTYGQILKQALSKTTSLKVTQRQKALLTELKAYAAHHPGLFGK